MSELMPILTAQRLGKRFAGVTALDDVSLRVMPGEVLAVIGENGAGKSTLMKILAGVLPADSGQIYWDGQPLRLRNVSEALQLGIALIHQELNLVDNLSVAENLFLGREPQRLGLVDRRRLRLLARQALDRVGLVVPPDTPLETLSIADRVLVMHDQQIRGQLVGDAISESAIMALAVGPQDASERLISVRAGDRGGDAFANG